MSVWCSGPVLRSPRRLELPKCALRPGCNGYKVSRDQYRGIWTRLKGNAVRIIAAPGCQGRRAGKGLVARADTLLAESDGVIDMNKSENQNESERDGMHMIWKILKAEVPLLVLTVCTITSGVLVTLGFPLALGDLFDVVRNHLENNSGTLFMEQKSMWEIGLGGYASLVKQAWQSAPPDFYPVLFRLSACLVLSAIGNAGSSFLAPTVGERVGRQLRKNTMEALMQKNQQFFDSHTAGEIMSRLNADCTAVQTTLVEFLGQRGLRSVLEIFFSLVVITRKNALLTIVALVVTPCLTLVLRGIVKKSSELTVKRQEAAAESMKFASERISGARTVQLFGQELNETKRYSEYTEHEYQTASRLAKFQGIVEGAGRFAVNMGALSLLAVGGFLVLQGQMQVGTLLAFQVYNFFLSIGLSSLSASLGDLGKVSGSLKRLQAIYNTEDSVPAALVSDLNATNGSNDMGPVQIRFENVWFRYPKSEDWVLKGISFVAKSGTLALVGPSGSGKSTIAALILGLYTPQKGSIYINGEKMTEFNVSRLRRMYGTMFQQPGLMSGTVTDQLRLGKEDATAEEILEAIKLAHCDDFIRDMSRGLNSEVGERGGNLSGGQQQRIALARALIRKPRLLVLDEPTAALDVASEKYIDAALQGLTQCTKVIIAHRLSTIRRADLIIVLESGNIVETGNHDELMNHQGGVYREMVNVSIDTTSKTQSENYVNAHVE